MIIWNYDKIRENIKKIKNPILVLKDDAYGVGIETIVKLALENNIHMYAVNTPEEGKRILRIDKTAYVILISPIKEVDKRFIYTVGDMDDFIFCLDNNLSFHYELNINMNRFGFNDINQSIINNKLCEGVFFHSNTINLDNDILRFRELLKKIKRRDLIFHLGGSGYLNVSHSLHNRVGIKIYENAYKMIGKVIKIRNVAKGEYIGYGDTYKAKRDMMVAILDIGYKNGLLENGTYQVIINNNIYNTIGKLCMDYLFIEVDDMVHIEDEATVIIADFRSEHEILVNIR
ncbi:MAG: alanine racemase C-terminal domain-containing protein [Anaeroplasmataceae bacterium]